jgi:thymidine phosphorylase
MLALGGLALNPAAGRASAEAAVRDGRAAERFARMVAALGGPVDFLERSSAHLAHAPVVKACPATRSGYVTGMDARQVGIAVVTLGGGRGRADDTIDPSVGLADVAETGRAIRPGDPLCLVHAASETAADAAIVLLRRAIRIGDAPPRIPPIVLERIGR